MSAEEDIRWLLSSYVQRHDNRDVDGVVSLFSRDARVVARSGEYVGEDALRGFWGTAKANLPAGRRTKHHLGSSHITVNGDTAESLSDVMVFESLSNGPWSIQGASQYIDKFGKENGEWRITERRIESFRAP